MRKTIQYLSLPSFILTCDSRRRRRCCCSRGTRTKLSFFRLKSLHGNLLKLVSSPFFPSLSVPSFFFFLINVLFSYDSHAKNISQKEKESEVFLFPIILLNYHLSDCIIFLSFCICNFSFLFFHCKTLLLSLEKRLPLRFRLRVKRDPVVWVFFL